MVEITWEQTTLLKELGLLRSWELVSRDNHNNNKHNKTTKIENSLHMGFRGTLKF